MTNLEALRHSVTLPVEDLPLEKILLDRSIGKLDTYTGPTAVFELAIADLLVLLVSQPNVSESGYSLSVNDANNMKQRAGQLYEKHGEANPFTATIKDASNRW